MSLRKAINDHCRACIYDKAAAGTWRQQVESCPVAGCALYPHRPRPTTSKTTPIQCQNEASAGVSDTGGGRL